MNTSAHCVLICAPFGRDAQSMDALLSREGYRTQVCRSLEEVAVALDGTTGAILLTEEALQTGIPSMREALQFQPPWSDIPVVLLASRQVGPLASREYRHRHAAELTSNLTVLERPLSSVSLVSAVASALRARQRQFDLRTSLEQTARNTQELIERNRALAVSQSALMESEAKFLAITNSIDQMVWAANSRGEHDYFNLRWHDFTGTSPERISPDAWHSPIHCDDRDSTIEHWQRSLLSGEAFRAEYRLLHYSGDYRWVLGRAQPVRHLDGTIVRWYGTCTEIDELIAAREVLARSRQELEALVEVRTTDLTRANEYLRQSQKMEAVGQLTGGIAHDFNNLLTGILGALSIIKRRLDGGRLDDVDRFIASATTSAQSAASLTHRLLAFSRRQPLDPKPVEVNRLILSLKELMERTLNEQIVLKFDLKEALPAVLADGHQLESALLNLVINARDAMPSGGQLTLRTVLHIVPEEAESDTDALPGHYVAVLVGDTGVGMSPEVLEKVYERFFTTKPVGQGTGLGLSMVYGFVKQSGGHVRISSRPGAGATVALYLPVTSFLAQAEGAVPAVSQGQGRQVLVVEDDAGVRLMICEALMEMDYCPIEAASSQQAIPLLQSERVIDLMISDIGLPGMGGRELADFARTQRPRLPILFATGYAHDAMNRPDFLQPGMLMITKPFSPETLSKAIEQSWLFDRRR